MEKTNILNKEVAEKKIRRMALEIAERNITEQEIILMGIRESGLVIANKICIYLKDVFSGKVLVSDIKIDKKQPVHVSTDSHIDFTGKVIIMVDDVANSGRTMLYALKPFLDKYPKKIQTAALVERTYKNFPIELDYVGLSISTAFDEHITVEVQGDEVLGAWMD